MKNNFTAAIVLILSLDAGYIAAYPTSCSAVLGCNACIETQCLNGHRFTTMGNPTDPVGNNAWSDKVCMDAYGIAANWEYHPISPGLSQPWRPIWGKSCPTYRTFTNKTPYEALIQFLNIAAGHKNADGTYSADGVITIDDSGVHGLDENAPLMILQPGQSQKINYSHADIVHTVIIIKGKDACVAAGQCTDCEACALEKWNFAESFIGKNLNFTVIMPNQATVKLVADANQEPLL